MARLGEDIAASFLVRRGATMITRNVSVGRGEIDLVVRHDGDLVAVEVKTIGAGAFADDPIDRIDEVKLRQVRQLAQQLEPRRAQRVDFVGVRLDEAGVYVNWRTNVA
ncbi:MAG TPA: YraN family protein [Acidimicrobiia bacterium]|nr:YraN family protein [Acidimicrobiia bacterium]